MATCFPTNGIPSEVVSSKRKEFALQESKLFPASQKEGTNSGAQHQKTYLWKCVPSEDSYQPGQSRSLIRIFTGRMMDSRGCEVSLYGQLSGFPGLI